MPDPPPIGFNFDSSVPPAAFSYPSLPTAPDSDPKKSSSSSSSSSDHPEESLEEATQSRYFTSGNEISSFCGGAWQFCTKEGPFPKHQLVRAGIDEDGATIFVGRAFHEGDMIPAKVIPDKNSAFICYDGEEIAKEEFEILRQGNFCWEFHTNGSIPADAVEIGRTADGEKLYMGRAMYQGTLTPGKVQVSHGCLYIPFNGEEVSIAEYEVLCIK